MNYEDISKELNSLFPRLFADTDQNNLKELSSMKFPRRFVKMFAQRCPSQLLDIGRITLFTVTDLINENIWESPGEDLYELGFSIVGLAPEGMLYCLNMNNTNKNGFNDILLVDPQLDYTLITTEEARATMKFLGDNFEVFLAKEVSFARKAKKSPKATPKVKNK